MVILYFASVLWKAFFFLRPTFENFHQRLGCHRGPVSNTCFLRLCTIVHVLIPLQLENGVSQVANGGYLKVFITRYTKRTTFAQSPIYAFAESPSVSFSTSL